MEHRFFYVVSGGVYVKVGEKPLFEKIPLKSEANFVLDMMELIQQHASGPVPPDLVRRTLGAIAPRPVTPAKD